MNLFKETGHLFRFAGLFVLALLAFFSIRGFVVPKSFGEYGHYRGRTITEMAARPVRFAGHQACESCHTDVVATKAVGRHVHVNCEACHGPLANHASDPGSVTPALPEVASLCVRCHAASAAKPKGFPQVDPAEHSGGMSCKSCHNPHNPTPGADPTTGAMPATTANQAGAGGMR